MINFTDVFRTWILFYGQAAVGYQSWFRIRINKTAGSRTQSSLKPNPEPKYLTQPVCDLNNEKTTLQQKERPSGKRVTSNIFSSSLQLLFTNIQSIFSWPSCCRISRSQRKTSAERTTSRRHSRGSEGHAGAVVALSAAGVGAGALLEKKPATLMT